MTDADKRALWAVRVLDRFDPTWGHGRVSGWPAVVTSRPGQTPRWFRQKKGPLSADAARIAAAEALVAEDPSPLRRAVESLRTVVIMLEPEERKDP